MPDEGEAMPKTKRGVSLKTIQTALTIGTVAMPHLRLQLSKLFGKCPPMRYGKQFENDSIYEALLQLIIMSAENAKTDIADSGILKKLKSKNDAKGKNDAKVHLLWKQVLTYQYLDAVNKLEDNNQFIDELELIYFKDDIETLISSTTPDKENMFYETKFTEIGDYVALCKGFVHLFEVDLSILQPHYPENAKADNLVEQGDDVLIEMPEIRIFYDPEQDDLQLQEEFKVTILRRTISKFEI